MTNAELIKALRCKSNDINDCTMCAYHNACYSGTLDEIAADALEAANKTVIPHRNYERCHIYWCDCGWFLQNKDKTPNYCPNCGKRIEWESAE